METGPRSLPATGEPNVNTVHLSAEEIKLRLVARERDMRYHLDALKHEASTAFDDVNVGGRPLMDRIRQRPELATLAAAGVGALVGVLLGVRARRKRRPVADDDIDFIRARLGVALEDAAHRAARGADVEDALRDAMDTMPVVYGDAQAAAVQARSSFREAIDVAVKSAVAIAAKSLMDSAIRKYTGHEGAFDALSDED
ncbi:hypothetical protein [Rubrivirga marina]|uniref:DUF3618 domain-containing protein n=1 Tax=Rubrivirga marina TaxID=1196024 RepID=A0A271J434_9BACT|nr:hypothetical protein [Rubrivirga marina]PAP77459.1 hypothetical protein BSZ37_13945 [Rubrivirga marina]